MHLGRGSGADLLYRNHGMHIKQMVIIGSRQGTKETQPWDISQNYC
jgi:hypothetical protein